MQQPLFVVEWREKSRRSDFELPRGLTISAVPRP
jgi:hypothetical protein